MIDEGKAKMSVEKRIIIKQDKMNKINSLNDNLKGISIIKTKSEISEGVSENSELEDIDLKAFVDHFGCEIADEGEKSGRNQA